MRLKQCRLRRDDVETIGWIDERGARLGCVVELLVKPEPELWTVAEVWDFALDEAALAEHNRLNRGSLPSLVRA